MPSEETRRILKVFGVAVTNLEDALDRKAPMDEVTKWDQEVAERTRETLALIDRRSTQGDDPESAATSDPVRFEVVVVHREHGGQRFALGEVHQRRVGEIHRSVSVADHQGIQGGKIRSIDRRHGHRARAKERPCGVDITRPVPR